MQRKRSTRLALTVALAFGVLAASAASASAATEYKNGNGAFTAVSVVNPPPQECATYRAYNAALVLTDTTVPVTATVSSDPNPTSPNFAWGEFATGTFQSTSCAGSPGEPIGGFTGTLTGGANCTLSDGTYRRGGSLGGPKPELSVQYEFSTATGPACSVSTPVTIKATIPSVDLPAPIVVGPFRFDYLSACNSPIAPQSCVLGPAQGF